MYAKFLVWSVHGIINAKIWLPESNLMCPYHEHP